MNPAVSQYGASSGAERFRVALMKTIPLPDGTPVPVLGQGTWKMGEGEREAKREIAALRLGIAWA